MRFDQTVKRPRSNLALMESSTTQEPSRRLTRSMAFTTVRRSARLRNDRDRRRSSSQPPLLLEPNTLSVRRGIEKRKGSSAPALVKGQSHDSKSRRQCGQIEVQVKRAAWRAGVRKSAVSEGSSGPTSIAACRQGSSQMKELEEQLNMALQAKQELAAQVKEHMINSSQSNLKHLEDYFTCPLCFEIMACPYALIPHHCGHSFCATCILKWFFSRLHKACGSWHEAVDCPSCRSALPYTPERAPRPASSFPFTPNRTADIAIRGLIDTISHGLSGSSASASTPLSDWNEDGHIRREWIKRDMTGRTEMTSLASQWNTLKPVDFVQIKNHLEV